MNGSEIASLVLGSIGNIAPLVASLIGKSAEDSQAILEQLDIEVSKMTSVLRDGGSLDRSFADSDAKLDAAIAKVEADR